MMSESKQNQNQQNGNECPTGCICENKSDPEHRDLCMILRLHKEPYLEKTKQNIFIDDGGDDEDEERNEPEFD